MGSSELKKSVHVCDKSQENISDFYVLTVDKTPETDMKMTENDVYLMIQDLKPYWYDLFLLLGFSHEQLAECKRKYVLEPQTAMRHLIPKWLEADALEPSWKTLVSVIRYKLLEEDVAANIEKKFCVQEEHPPSSKCPVHNCLGPLESVGIC